MGTLATSSLITISRKFKQTDKGSKTKVHITQKCRTRSGHQEDKVDQPKGSRGGECRVIEEGQDSYYLGFIRVMTTVYSILYHLSSGCLFCLFVLR